MHAPRHAQFPARVPRTRLWRKFRSQMNPQMKRSQEIGFPPADPADPSTQTE